MVLLLNVPCTIHVALSALVVLVTLGVSSENTDKAVVICSMMLCVEQLLCMLILEHISSVLCSQTCSHAQATAESNSSHCYLQRTITKPSVMAFPPHASHHASIACMLWLPTSSFTAVASGNDKIGACTSASLRACMCACIRACM